MSIWTDTAVKELQEKVAWLEKEIAEIKKHAQSPKPLGLPTGKGKPS